MAKNVLPHLYEDLANDAMFGIIVFDEADGKSFYMNQMSVQLLGCEQMRLIDLIPDRASGRSQLVNFSPEFLRHDGLYHDILIGAPDGRTLIANVGIKNKTVDDKPVNIVMIQDVTLQKKLQREITAKQTEIHAAHSELLKQNQQLKELDVAKNRFIAITTHELRTPLSAMVASAEILKLGLYDNKEQMQEFVDIIHDQGKHLSDLVNDILDFAKIQAGKMDFYIENQNIITELLNILRNFTDMAASNGVEIKFENHPEKLDCYFDEVRLRQVVSNIVNNGIKYNKNGGSLTVTLEDSPEVARILFTDTGKGIPEDQFDKVFNEFETIGNVAQHHKGTGLGMPISRKLIHGMGGKLDFTSTFGTGSTFWIEVPKTKVLDEDVYRPRPEKTGDLAA